MSWGVIVYESGHNYWSLVMADDMLYEGMKNSIQRDGSRVLFGRKGINDGDIDGINLTINKVVARLNSGEDVNLEKELAPFTHLQ